VPVAHDGVVLQLQSLSKSYRGSPALTDVTLDLCERTILGVVGRSGTGKTTLLKIVCGLIVPSSGRVVYRGTPLTKPTPDIAMVFQDYGRSLLPWRSVLENVCLPLEARCPSFADVRARARDHIRMVGLGAVENRYPHELSGGMQQRVAVARALAQDAKIVLMDEPFSSLDTVTKFELEDTLLTVAKETCLTLMIVSHDLDDALFLSDEVLVLGRRTPSIVGRYVIPIRRPREQIATRSMPEFSAMRRTLSQDLFAGSV
jgi:NitT/TauT family transport system ATP-binding protein